MRRTRVRPRGSWVGAGSLGMAALAVVALGVTLFIAMRALHEAESTVVRGESDALLATLGHDLLDEESNELPGVSQLQRQLEAHAEAGVRYLALVERDGSRVIAEAGSATMSQQQVRPGELAIADQRVKILGGLMPPRRQLRRHDGSMPFGLRGPTWLVVEFEPPVIRQLRADLMRISFVAAAAGAVLLGFAIALTRNARRIEEYERKAAREQRLISLGSMASVMAHELRNPLASLKGHAQLLAEDLENDGQSGDPKRLQRAERVVSEAERLERLTSSLLDFVRDGPLEREALTPADLVTRALHDLDPSRVEVRLDDAPALVEVDAARMARALHNLVDNALQASETEGTPVTLTMLREGSELRIEIRDRGPGIDADTKLFEPFVTTRVRGTGLGLSVARRIAEQHGGSVTGENHPEGGALFLVRIPSTKASS